MPPQTDTVLMKAQDGKAWNIPRVNVDKAKARGFTLIEPPGAVQRGKEGLRETMGFSPEGGPVEDVKQIGAGLKQEFTHPIDSAKLLLDALMKGQQDVFGKGMERINKPGVMNKVEGAAQVAESGVPGLGPILSGAGEKFEKGDVAGGVGSMIPVLFGQAAETPMGRTAAVGAADTVGKVVGKPAETVRDYLGGDAREVARAKAEHVQKMEAINLENIQKQNTIDREHTNAVKAAEAKHQEAVNTAEGTTLQKQANHKIEVARLEQEHAAKVAKQAQDYKDKVAAAAREHEDAISGFSGGEPEAAKATDAQTKQDFNAGRGPAWQRVKGMTDKIAASVEPLMKKVRQTYDARWGAWREAMGPETTGDFTPVMKAVEDAESTLTGAPEDIKIFKDILKEGEDPLLGSATVFRGGGAGIDVKDLTGSRYMSEATRNRVLQSLRDAGIDEETGRSPIQQTSLPIDDIRGYATDLQRKMLGGRYNPKIYKALKMVQQAAEGEVGRVAKSKGQFDRWQQLKGDWSQMLDDFNNSDGALYKLRNAVNTDARLNLLTGADADRIIEALGRYSAFDTDVNSVGRLRSLVHQINDLPSSAKPVTRAATPPRPAPVPDPKIPYPPAPEKTPEYKAPTKPEFTPKDVTPFNEQAFRRDNFLKVLSKYKGANVSDRYAITAAITDILTHGNPKWAVAALSYPVVRRLLGHVMDRPSVEAWVTKERAKYQ
jgi:hypothetical protein